VSLLTVNALFIALPRSRDGQLGTKNHAAVERGIQIGHKGTKALFEGPINLYRAASSRNSAAGGSIDCKAAKRALTDARRRRTKPNQREQREFEKAESKITSFVLISHDSADPPRRIVETMRWFDWAAASPLQKPSFGKPAADELRQC
jgi:hypothetical protein